MIRVYRLIILLRPCKNLDFALPRATWAPWFNVQLPWKRRLFKGPRSVSAVVVAVANSSREEVHIILVLGKKNIWFIPGIANKVYWCAHLQTKYRQIRCAAELTRLKSIQSNCPNACSTRTLMMGFCPSGTLPDIEWDLITWYWC